MGYLVCEGCGGYYKLQPGESPEDFSDKCECGGNTHYVENLTKNKELNETTRAILCPHCGTLNSEDSKLCKSCKKALKKVEPPSKSGNGSDGPNIIRLWAVILIIVLMGVGSFLIYFTYTNTNDEFSNIAEQINPDVFESGLTAEDYMIPADSDRVTTGIYIDRIKSISIKDNIWTVDFYIWFKWTGNFTPGDTFQVMDGSIDKKELVRTSSNGDEKFALYKVTSTVTKEFDVFRFPVDTQFLAINIQDKNLGRDELVYIADNESSSVGSGVHVPGYTINGLHVIEKPYYYNSTMGDPNRRILSSELRVGMLISREDLTVLFVSLLGTFVAVFAALMSLLIVSFQGRFSMEGSAMFVGITNMVLITNLAPTGIITLGHLINGLGLFIISLCLLESSLSISYNKIKRSEEQARKLDKVTLIILSIGFVSITLAMIIIAK